MEVGCEYSPQSVEIAIHAGETITSIIAHITEVTNMNEIIANAIKKQGVIMRAVNINISQINIID